MSHYPAQGSTVDESDTFFGTGLVGLGWIQLGHLSAPACKDLVGFN